MPDEVVLTYPASWSERRKVALREAAREAGIEHPHLLEEPVAAAIYFTGPGSNGGASVAAGDSVAVYDLGGGTFDTAVLRRSETGWFEPIGVGGRDGLGGEVFDTRLFRYLGRMLSESSPKDWHAINRSPRALQSFRREVRAAKEALSVHGAYDVVLPEVTEVASLRVTRSELEDLLQNDVQESVSILVQTCDRAGLEPAQLSGVFLVGGSSRIPLVADRIARELGRVPEMRDNPKAVVALGAAAAGVQQSAAPPSTPDSTTQPAVQQPPVASARPAPPLAAEPAAPPPQPAADRAIVEQESKPKAEASQARADRAVASRDRDGVSLAQGRYVPGASAREHAPAAPPPRSSGGQKGVRRLVWPVAAGLAFVAGIGVAVVLGSGSSNEGSSKRPAGKLIAGKLAPVPTNHQEGAGEASLRLKGNVATVTLSASGLLDNAPHAMHIHGGAAGECPPASAAKLHDGHRAISTSNGAPFYGKPRTSLTTKGPTGPASILAFPRYPATGRITYTRKIKLIPSALHYVRQNNAVIIVHGIDYNHNGLYDGVLDRSELNPEVQGETTAPALCGPIRSAQSASAGEKVYTASLTVQALAPAEPGRICILRRPTG